MSGWDQQYDLEEYGHIERKDEPHVVSLWAAITGVVIVIATAAIIIWGR